MTTPSEDLKQSISHFVMTNAEQIMISLNGIPWMIVASADPLTPRDMIVSRIPEPVSEYLPIAVRAVRSRHVLVLSVDTVNQTRALELREDCGEIALSSERFAGAGPDQPNDQEIAAIAARFLHAVERHLDEEHGYPTPLDNESQY